MSLDLEASHCLYSELLERWNNRRVVRVTRDAKMKKVANYKGRKGRKGRKRDAKIESALSLYIPSFSTIIFLFFKKKE